MVVRRGGTPGLSILLQRQLQQQQHVLRWLLLLKGGRRPSRCADGQGRGGGGGGIVGSGPDLV